MAFLFLSIPLFIVLDKTNVFAEMSPQLFPIFYQKLFQNLIKKRKAGIIVVTIETFNYSVHELGKKNHRLHDRF